MAFTKYLNDKCTPSSRTVKQAQNQNDIIPSVCFVIVKPIINPKHINATGYQSLLILNFVWFFSMPNRCIYYHTKMGEQHTVALVIGFLITILVEKSHAIYLELITSRRLSWM